MNDFNILRIKEIGAFGPIFLFFIFKDKLIKLFEQTPGIKCLIRYRNEVAKVLGTKDIKNILGISSKTAYDLMEKDKIRDDIFKVIEIGRNKKIPRDSFLI